MNRYYETTLPESNYNSALDCVALGQNNHIAKVFLDPSNEYGGRIILNCWSEHDGENGKWPDPATAKRWYTVRDHKGDVFVAEIAQPTAEEIASWQVVLGTENG